MSYDVGDLVSVSTTVKVAEVLTDATMLLTVTAPDGTVSTPAVTRTSLGTYTASVPATQVGEWTCKWTASGAVTAVETTRFTVGVAPRALGAPYVTVAELKAYLKIGDTQDDPAITDAVTSVSRDIEAWCGRQFNDAGAVTARTYYPTLPYLCDVDDFSTVTGLVIATDMGNDGTYETVWAAADYQLEPLNGVVDGQTGWPYCKVRAVGGQAFPIARRTPVSVTARWGWANVPSPVRQAAMLLSSEMFKLAGAPFGVAGFDNFGVVRVRDSPKARGLLAPYRRHAVLVG